MGDMDVPMSNWALCDDLLEYNEPGDTYLLYPCRACGELLDICCEPHEFDPEYHYCGRSPSCCP